MAFELSEEFVKEHGLSTAQVEAVTKFGVDTVTGINEGWQNTLEEKITERTNVTFEGATLKIEKESGIKRNEGEAAAAYIARVNNEAFSEMKLKAEEKLAKAEQALLDATKDGASKEELEKLRGRVETLQVKEAEFDKLMEDDITGKFEASQQRVSVLEEMLAFSDAKPSFSPDVNEYEAKAKWEKFVSDTKALGDLKEIDNKWYIVDKDNPEKKKLITDLVKSNEDIQGIVKGRQQQGSGTKPTDFMDIEGVSFKIPVGADGKTIDKLLTDHLAGKGLDYNTKEFSKQYGEMYSKIKKRQTA